ncbi:MAG: hypothetical protein KatS3mg105_2917 [Gemmatales bacterium]|nr:MAG: hypothetical protein KatS3mg105_2917 [Gemmatales bacterium]
MKRSSIGRREFISQAAASSALGWSGLAHGNDPGKSDDLDPSQLPATNMESFCDAIRKVVNSKRIGEPVFVRCTLLGRDKKDLMIARLAQIVDAVVSWFGQPLHRIYAREAQARAISLVLDFQGGQTALLSYASSRHRGDGVDLMVIGNHGAIYHDAGTGTLWDAEWQTKPKANAKTRTMIARAIQSAKPILVTPLKSER